MLKIDGGKPELTANQQHHQSLVPDMSGRIRNMVRRCDSCGGLLDKWNEPLFGLRISKRRFDISVTYDGITVATERFRDLYNKERLTGLTFQQLPDDQSFFAIKATRAVAFDVHRRETSFEDQCHKCSQFRSVAGATPVYLIEGSKIGIREFVRTDVEFGSDDGKHPLFLCGELAASVLQSARLNGIKLFEI